MAAESLVMAPEHVWEAEDGSEERQMKGREALGSGIEKPSHLGRFCPRLTIVGQVLAHINDTEALEYLFLRPPRF